MGHSFTNLLYHFDFATKRRQPWIDPQLKAALHAQLGAIVKKEGGIALIVNGMPDHVHILAKLRADHKVSDMLRDVKSQSSGWIHRTRKDLGHFCWQTGYGAFTVSDRHADIVHAYIKNQERHHLYVAFEKEFTNLLREHGVEFDEATLWDED